jgi:hypothetical protein
VGDGYGKMEDDQAFRLEQAQNVGLGFELKAQLVSMQEVEVVEVKDSAQRFDAQSVNQTRSSTEKPSWRSALRRLLRCVCHCEITILHI